MITIDDAVILATKALKGHYDLEGLPAILHSLRVMLAGDNEDEMIVGVLHDVVEDTDLGFEDLKKAGCSDEYIDALRLLTHNKEVQYFDYVERIVLSGNKLAVNVKRHDLEDNLKRGRKYKHWEIVEKHEKAFSLILRAVK